MNMPYADILILALVAGFILLRLRSILGKDVGFDGKSDPSNQPPKPLKDASNNDSAVLSFPQLQALAKAKAAEVVASDQKTIDALDASVKSDIEAIKAADAQFNLDSFLGGAKAAFEMVIKAFNGNDKITLAMLMKPTLAEVFIREAELRLANENRPETTLVRIVSAEVKAAELSGKMARITLVILSEQVHVVRNKEGEIVEGNPSHVERVEDEWVFERDVTSKNPNWTIIDT
jgi:predicted lipid-binding transport protein (Tim44 family)